MSRASNTLGSQEVEALAMALDEQVAWSAASKVLNHSGWIDVIECIREQSPQAYHELKCTYADQMLTHYRQRGWL